MKKTILIWIGVFGVTFAALFLMIRSQTKPSEEPINSEISVITAQDRTIGNKDSGVVLVEYGDFQCPGCGQYEPIVHKVREDFKDKILFVYRHFIFAQKHTNAEPAAWAAEAAEKQGKFWEMHDMIFEHQNEWSEKSNAEDIFLQYASSLGLDLEKFNRDRDAETTKDKVQKSYDSAVANFINATPTFFLNGERIQPRSYEEFVGLIAKFNK